MFILFLPFCLFGLCLEDDLFDLVQRIASIPRRERKKSHPQLVRRELRQDRGVGIGLERVPAHFQPTGHDGRHGTDVREIERLILLRRDAERLHPLRDPVSDVHAVHRGHDERLVRSPVEHLCDMRRIILPQHPDVRRILLLDL